MLLYELHKKGLALILPKDVAAAQGIHLQNNSWAPKKGKPCGRNVVNASGVSAPWTGVPLNTDEVKDAAALRWGDIRHPVDIYMCLNNLLPKKSIFCKIRVVTQIDTFFIFLLGDEPLKIQKRFVTI